MRDFLSNYWTKLAVKIRSSHVRRIVGNCAADFIAYGKVTILQPSNVTIGNDVSFAQDVFINARAQVTIGDHVRISPYVRINTGGLNLEMPPNKRFDHVNAPVKIGNYVWLATGVIINPGVTIHDGVVVGAGAVVTRDLPPNTLCVGIPAKPIRNLLPLESAAD